MICYRDMTFCRYDDCEHFASNECGRAFNAQAKAGARAWMGDDAPVCFYSERPDCFEPAEYEG